MPISPQVIGDIKIGDPGLTINCNYKTVLQIAVNEAKKIGANALKITEHKLPNTLGSSCHRIKVLAFRVDDVSPYETEIVWHKDRPLKTVDFKGAIDKRPFLAVTSSGIVYEYAGRPIDGYVKVTTYARFNCLYSYFKDSINTAETLEHEQGHFDITEIFARKLIKTFKEEIRNTKELQAREQTIYAQIAREWQLMQDEYDSDVYANPLEQPFWLHRIKVNLEALSDYEHKEIRIPF